MSGDEAAPPPAVGTGALPVGAAGGMRVFIHVLVNTAVANLVSGFLWFAIVFWVYLETRSILATGILGGAYMILLAGCSMWFGSLIDRFRKKRVMLVSACATFVTFAVGCIIYVFVPRDALLQTTGPWFWIFAVVLLAGAVVELLRNLALTTTVTLLVPPDRHANANGLVGAVQGLAFLATSVLSGLSVGLLGMGPTLVIATVCVGIPIVHLALLKIPEPEIVRDPTRSAIDFRGGMAAILAVPGLFALVLFSMFNNFSGGVFMTLLDPYGLTMFPVEVWGIVFGVSATGFIIGGAVVAKFGLGRNPIRTLLILVAVIGAIGILFTLRERAWLFITGIWLFMAIMPAVEAAEQTVIQRVVPYEKQGRVFGLAMTFEAAAAPITALAIAPIAEFWIVPMLESRAGIDRWAWLLGTGESRGIALICVVTGAATIALAGFAATTRSARVLVRSWRAAAPGRDVAAESPDNGVSAS